LRLATRHELATISVGRKRFPAMSSKDQAPAVATHSKPFIVARSRHVVPKDRRIERLPSGYTVLEPSDHSDGDYWFVVTALEVAS
jgi:hypothetical protein